MPQPIIEEPMAVTLNALVSPGPCPSTTFQLRIDRCSLEWARTAFRTYPTCPYDAIRLRATRVSGARSIFMKGAFTRVRGPLEQSRSSAKCLGRKDPSWTELQFDLVVHTSRATVICHSIQTMEEARVGNTVGTACLQYGKLDQGPGDSLTLVSHSPGAGSPSSMVLLASLH